MATNYPTALDTFTTRVDNVDNVMASHVNNLQDSVLALETKLGITSSVVTTTADYLLRNLPSQGSTSLVSNLNAQYLNSQLGSYYTNVSNVNAGVLGASYGGAGTVNGIMKANGAGTVSAASSGTDYAPATSGSAILSGNGAGGHTNVTVGTGLTFSSNTLKVGNSMGTVVSITTSGTYSPATDGFVVIYCWAQTGGSRGAISASSDGLTAQCSCLYQYCDTGSATIPVAKGSTVSISNTVYSGSINFYAYFRPYGT